MISNLCHPKMFGMKYMKDHLYNVGLYQNTNVYYVF